MKLIPILLLSLSCSVFGADNASKIPEISSIQSEYELALKSNYSVYMTLVKNLEAKIIKKMEEKLKLITVTGDLDKAILIKAEIEKLRNGSMRQAIIAAFSNEKETDLLGNDVEKKVEGANDQVLKVVCGKWKSKEGYIATIKPDGTCFHTFKNLKGTWKFEDNKAILTWDGGLIDTYTFIDKNTINGTNNKGGSFTNTRIIESK